MHKVTRTGRDTINIPVVNHFKYKKKQSLLYVNVNIIAVYANSFDLLGYLNFNKINRKRTTYFINCLIRVRL